jgi:hypothetical protein
MISSANRAAVRLQLGEVRPHSQVYARSPITGFQYLFPERLPDPFPSDDDEMPPHVGHLFQIRHGIPEEPEIPEATVPVRREFPRDLPLTIGLRRGLHYCEIDPTIPGPQMPPPETLSSPPITIGERFWRDCGNGIPGPGAYTPARLHTTRRARSIERGPPRGSLWVIPTSGSPGPGAYNVVPGLPRPKKWNLRHVRPFPAFQFNRTAEKESERDEKIEEE